MAAQTIIHHRHLPCAAHFGGGISGWQDQGCRGRLGNPVWPRVQESGGTGQSVTGRQCEVGPERPHPSCRTHRDARTKLHLRGCGGRRLVEGVAAWLPRRLWRHRLPCRWYFPLPIPGLRRAGRRLGNQEQPSFTKKQVPDLGLERRQVRGGMPVGPFLSASTVRLKVYSSHERSSRRPLKITRRDAPMSAAMAAHNEANPANVNSTKSALTAKEKAMF